MALFDDDTTARWAPAADARPDTTVIKVDGRFSPRGSDGQVYLASGISVAMRLWQGRADRRGRRMVEP